MQVTPLYLVDIIVMLCNIIVGFVSLVCTGPTELKTLTLSAGVYILIYSLPPMHRQGDTRSHSLVIDTLTDSRKRCKEKTQ